MTTPRAFAACIGGTMAFVALCYSVLFGSADAGRLFLTLVPPLIVFIWWMVDREALERRIRRLEARSEIADKRRVSAQTDLTEVVHKLHKIEGRVVDVESLASPASVSEEPRCLDIRTRRVSLKQIRQPEPAREGDSQEVQER